MKKLLAVAVAVFLSALSQNVLGNGNDVEKQLLQVYDETQTAQIERLAATIKAECTKDKNTRVTLYRSRLTKKDGKVHLFVSAFIGGKNDPMPHTFPQFREVLQLNIADSGQEIVPGEDRIAWYMPKNIECSMPAKQDERREPLQAIQNETIAAL